MRIIAVSDLHLTLKENYGVTLSNGLNSRVEDKLNALRHAVDYTLENKADLFVDTGDTFDLLNPPEVLRYRFIEIISKLLVNNIPVIIIMGNHVYNHTYYNLQSEEHLLKSLGSTKMEIISKPETRKIDNIPFTFMPWNYIDQAEDYFKANPDAVVFHHLPINGAVLNDYQVKAKEGLTSEVLNTQVAFIGGHYHLHQIEGNYCYVGSLVKQDFGEKDQKKGFVDIKIGENLSSIDINFIEIEDRKFLQLDFGDPIDPIDYIKTLGDVKDSIIKSKFTGNKRWLYNINKSEYIKILEDNGALRVLQPELIDSEEPLKKSDSMSSKESFESNVISFCDKKNRKDCEPLMLDILKEVQNTRKVI